MLDRLEQRSMRIPTNPILTIMSSILSIFFIPKPWMGVIFQTSVIWTMTMLFAQHQPAFCIKPPIRCGWRVVLLCGENSPVFASIRQHLEVRRLKCLQWSYLSPLSWEKVRLLLSSKAMGWDKYCLSWVLGGTEPSSPRLASLTLRPSGAPTGPLIKDRVCLSISLTATHAEQRHADTRTHSRLHLSIVSHEVVPWYNPQIARKPTQWENTYTHT